MAEQFHLSDKEFSLFCEVTASFHTIRDMDEMILDIFSKIIPILNIEGASIALHDPANKEFYFQPHRRRMRRHETHRQRRPAFP